MKKAVSILLSILLLVDAFPWGILPVHAAYAEEEGITRQQLRAALALTGLDSGAAVWHAGMSVRDCNNAAQLLDALDEYIYEELDSVMDIFQDYDVTDADESIEFDLETSPFYTEYRKAMILRDQVYYCKDVLAENSRQILYLSQRMQDTDVSEEEKQSYGYAILEYYKELTTVCQTVKTDFDTWKKTVDTWDRMLCGESDDFRNQATAYSAVMDIDSSVYPTGKPVYLSMEKEFDVRPGNRIMDRLSPVRSALADSKKKMEITVVDDRSFLVRVRENGTNISGAEITLKDVDKNGKTTGKSTKTVTTNDRGLGLGLVRDFSPDSGGNLTLDIGVKKSGYRTVSLRCVEIGKGNTYSVKVEKDDGTPYLIEASYNGTDMMNNRYDLLVSDVFDETDEMTLILYGKDSYSFDIYYTKDGKKGMLVSDVQGQSGKEYTYTLKKQYSKVLPGDAKVFVDIKSSGKTKTVSLQLNPIQAVVDEPMDLPGMASVFNKNIRLSLPKTWPGPLSGLAINIDIPIVNKWPFNAMLLPNGMAFVMIGFHKDKNALDLKNNQAKIMAKMVKVIENEGWRRVQEIKSGGASDFKLPVWKLASMSLDWCIMGYGTGQFTGVKGKDNLRVLRLLGNAGVNVRLQGDVQFIFGGIVTVGVTGSLNAIVSAGLGVNLFMARNGNSLSLQSFKFSPANSGLKISVRLEIGVFVGIGFKGILGVTVTGYGFLELLFRWGGATEFSLIGGFGARLTAQFFFVKLIKQLGDEVKYQLLPEFKRLSRNQIMLERFLRMFEPARAVADSKDKSPDVTTSQPYNKKLLLKSESGTDLSGVQGESLSVVRIESGDGQAQKKDYVFYMARESSSSKVGLYYRQIGPQMETASHSVLGLINNFHSGHETRFYIQDGLSYADVRTWDVVGFSVEVQRLKKYGVQQFSKHDLIVITMLMANEYREITAGDGTVTKVPKKTAAIVATFVNSDNGIEMATFTANPNIGTTPGTTVSCSSAACIFLVADENAEPVCRPQTESEVFLYDSGESSRTKDVLEDEVKHNYWIRLMVSPVSPAAGEKVKSFTIRLSLASDTPVGQIESRTLGQGNSGIQNYTFENVQAGVQSIPNHPYEKTASASGSSTSRVPAVQDHWYACAAPTGKSEERKLAVNYHFRDNEGLFVLDEDPILDFRIFKKEPLDGDSATSHASEHIVYLVKGADGKMNRLRCVYVTGQAVSSDTMYMRLDEAHLTDYDVGVSAARIHVSRIFKVPLVWWVETVSAEENGEKKALWAIRGCWMDDTLSQTYMSKPMTFALIQADQVNNPAGPVFFDLIEDSRDGNSGITGYYAIKSQDSSGGGNQVRLNRFFFKLTPGLDLLSAGFTKDIANAGSYDDVQIAIHNNGNMMISTFDLGVYHNNTKLQTIHVDMENNDRSYCEILHGKESGGTSPEKRYGSTAVHLIRSGLSSSDEDRWAVRKWTYERSGKINKVKEQKTATLSMPDSYDAVMVSVKIPHNWTGDYSVDLQVDKIEVRDRMNFQLKTAGSQAGTGALLPVNRLLRPAVALADDTALQTVGDLHSLQRGSDSGWVPDGQLSPEADDLMFSTDVTFDRLSVDMDPTDIELDVDVWYDGEEEMATLYLNENAVVSESGGKQVVVLRSYVDDEEEPSFEWVFDSSKTEYRNLLIRDRMGWSLDLPVSLLTAGKDASEILVTVDAGAEDEARFSNNYVILYQDSGPMEIVLEPEDREVDAGTDTTFSVEVRGGHRPYAYQWQVLMPGGKWTDIENACSSRLTLYGVYEQLDGAQYRCVIEDASGRILMTRAATLRVRYAGSSLPPTGDSMHLHLWLILLGACAMGTVLVRKRKKY